MSPPPLTDPVARKDAEHLDLLAIFHFVIAGFAVLGLLVLLLHFMVMDQVFNHPELWKDAKGGPPPQLFMGIFTWFYVLGGIILTAAGIANLLSGLFLKRRSHRTFSLVVAGLNCINVPLGTVLGVFTIIVLLRDSVAQRYALAPTLGMR